MPKLIGMFTLSFGLQRKAKADEPLTGAPREMIQRVATDTDGQQWGLVERLTPIPGNNGDNAYRVSFDRWIRFDSIPFEPGEIVTGETWSGLRKGG